MKTFACDSGVSAEARDRVSALRNIMWRQLLVLTLVARSSATLFEHEDHASVFEWLHAILVGMGWVSGGGYVKPYRTHVGDFVTNFPCVSEAQVGASLAVHCGTSPEGRGNTAIREGKHAEQSKACC